MRDSRPLPVDTISAIDADAGYALGFSWFSWIDDFTIAFHYRFSPERILFRHTSAFETGHIEYMIFIFMLISICHAIIMLSQGDGVIVCASR